MPSAGLVARRSFGSVPAAVEVALAFALPPADVGEEALSVRTPVASVLADDEAAAAFALPSAALTPGIGEDVHPTAASELPCVRPHAFESQPTRLPSDC